MCCLHVFFFRGRVLLPIQNSPKAPVHTTQYHRHIHFNVYLTTTTAIWLWLFLQSKPAIRHAAGGPPLRDQRRVLPNAQAASPCVSKLSLSAGLRY